MKLIYNSKGEHIGTVYDDNDVRDAGEGLAYIIIGIIMFMCLPFSPFFAHYRGKKDREENHECVSKIFSIVICWFLGAFGAHKFYEGKIGMGILYYFTGGLLGIGWVYDLISLFFRKGEFYNPDVKLESEDANKAKVITVIFLVVIPLLILVFFSAVTK